MSYSIKEAFYTLQGEGAHSGRPAVFCRFTGCNLWSGKEKHRKNAICNFCDTDFVGTDGEGGGFFKTSHELANHLYNFWPNSKLLTAAKPFIVITGGEPLLQLDQSLIGALKARNFYIAIETNGTIKPPSGIDWICMSPKANTDIIINVCDELKFVYPQNLLQPSDVEHIKATHYFLTPKAPPLKSNTDLYSKDKITQDTITYCLKNPKWKLNLQTHKIVGIN